jgi:hypothetical protein
MKKEITVDKAKKVGDRLKIDWGKFSVHQFKMGLKEELEHRDVTHGDYLVTGRIVLAHLKEKPDYYTRLQKAMK